MATFTAASSVRYRFSTPLYDASYVLFVVVMSPEQAVKYQTFDVSGFLRTTGLSLAALRAAIEFLQLFTNFLDMRLESCLACRVLSFEGCDHAFEFVAQLTWGSVHGLGVVE